MMSLKRKREDFMKIPGILALFLMLSSFAGAQTFEIRVTGQYTVGKNDTTDTAKQLAALDAGFKARDRAVAQLADQPSVKSLQLTELQLAAYVAGLIEPSAPVSTVDGKVHKSEIVVRLDDKAASRIVTLHEDREASLDLVEAMKRSRQLQEKLAEDNLAVGNASTAELMKAVQIRQQTIEKLQAIPLLAQARFVAARHELGPSSARVSSEEGRRQAMTLVERAIAIDATNPDARRVAGDIFLMEEEPAQAEKEYRDVLKQNPNSNIDHNKLGNALMDQGDIQEAAAEFKEAFRLNPSDAVSHADLGLILRATQNPSGAMAEFREALRIDPNYVDAHNYLGITMASQGQIPEALAEFQEIIRIQPNSSLGHFNAATALADLEKDEEAAKELRETVRLNPNHYNAHYNLGEMLRLLGELQESAKAFREYVNRAPDTPATKRNKEKATTYIKAFEEQ
jgi:tetratricopeptide (TPR) repeat protein